MNPMNKNKLYVILLGVFLLLTGLAGCRSELSPLQPVRDLRSGVRRISSSLAVAPTESALRTKSAYRGDDAAVSDWTLLQFDAASGLLAAAYYQPSGADIRDIEVVAGRSYDWFAVANAGDIRSQFMVGRSPSSAMKSWFVTGFDMRNAAGLPMAWAGEGIAFSKEDLSAGRRLEVKLTRLVARYDITVDKSALTRYSFAVEAVTIEGPASVRAFSESRGTDVATTTDAASAVDVQRLNAGGSATFYAAENCYGELSISDPDSKRPASLAPGDHPSFIEISGKATVLDGSGLTFPARYRFYLGRNASSNFDVIRNTENTVTLHLSDAKLDAARDEREAIDAGQHPDPLWKVEVDPYSDSRSLQFQHGAAAGGAGIRLSPRAYTAESVVRLPEGLSYQLRLDQGLYDAGVRVYLTASGGGAVLPETGYTEATWIRLTGSPETLYFYLPEGTAAASGQAHIRTLDGRKSDALTLSAGRVLDHLALQFASVTGINTSENPAGEAGSWGSRYTTPVDTVLMQNLNNGYPNGFALRVYAVYTDGSEQLLGSDAATAPYYRWETRSVTGTAAGVNKGYGSSSAYFFQKLKAVPEYRSIRTGHSGTGSFRIYYTENEVTKDLTATVRVHNGTLRTWPASKAADRIRLSSGGSVDLGYWWVDNNGKDSVNVTPLVHPQLSVTTGSTVLRYEGLRDGKARFRASGTPGDARASVSGTGYITHMAVASLFGDDPQKVRAASLPTSGGISSGNFDAFRYAYFTVLDERVLDHVAVVPDYIYVPDLANTTANDPASGTRLTFKLYAYYEGSDTPVDVTTDAGTVWSRVTGTAGSGGSSRANYFMGWIQNRTKFVYGRTPLASETSCYGFSDGYFWMKCSKLDVTSIDLYESYLTQGAIELPAALYTASYTFGGRTRQASIRGVVTKEAASLTLSPATVSLYTGASVALTATVTYTDGSSETVTDLAAWDNDASGLLNCNGGGRYTAGDMPGNTSVTARYGGLSATVPVTVRERGVSSFTLEICDAGGAWQQSSAVLTLGGRYPARLRVTYEDHTTGLVDAGFTLTSSVPAVAAQAADGTLSALAIGASRITASFKGKTSGNAVQVTVQNHDYTYELLLSPLGPASAYSYDQVKQAGAQSQSLAWDESVILYAYHVRLDHGTLDASYGAGGLLDVSDLAAWSVDPALTASSVGAWQATMQTYAAHNTSGNAVTGDVEADYAGLTARLTLDVASYEAPYLRIEESGPLSWNCWESGSSSAKTLTVSSNVAWTLSDLGDHWYVSRRSGSGNATLSVYPKSENEGGDEDVTLTVSASDPGLSDSIDLQHDGMEGRGRNKLWWRVVVTPATKTLAVGETFDRFQAYLYAYRDAGRTLQVGTPLDISNTALYEVSDPAVASVVSTTGGPTTGQATGLSAGSVTVRAWWAFNSSMPMTYRDGVPVEEPGEAALTVTATPPTVRYRIITALTPASVEWNGTAVASAMLQQSTDGGPWSDVRDVTASVSFTADKAIVTINGSDLSASNPDETAVTVSVKAAHYSGSEDIVEYVPAALLVGPKPAPPAASLSASPDAMSWAWDESGSGNARSVAVAASGCSWTVRSISGGFSHAVQGNAVLVWPEGQNGDATPLTGTLVIAGTNGVSDVVVSLSQAARPAPVLVRLDFDQDHYELVRVSGGEVLTSHSFTLTARYSDGSTADVTAEAAYADQGSVTVSALDGLLTATAACSGKRLTATFGGISATASYSAVDLEVPADLVMSHFESQEDQNREFVITDFKATIRKVLSGVQRRETVTGDVTVSAVDGLVVHDPQPDTPFLFHLTAAGSGTVRFAYTLDGVTLTRLLTVTCSAHNHITYTWE